jgi:hypothetical protein
MGPSGKAYNEVKAILNKLDRSIDDARRRRTDTGRPTSPVVSGAVPPSASAANITTTLLGTGGTIPTPTPTPPRAPSQFGRAQPLRPNGT